MEYVEPEAPSKPNFMAFNLTHSTPSFSDDDFFIDDLLDFSTDAAFLDENHNLQLDDTTNNHKTSPVNEDKTTPPETELCFPVNDVDDLEWVSRFVDDSVTYPVRKFPETETETETVTLVAVNATFKKLVNKRARSKRSRGSGGVWSLRSSAPLTESSTSSSSITSCTSKPLFGADENMEKATVQIRKRKRQAVMGGSARTSQPQTRRCSHCLVQKTPQWRAGPLGEKTLCNACGVRFKSGRLLPEYRPACSPSYSGEVHSNNHRKVLEMRRKKAACGGLIFPVHSS